MNIVRLRVKLYTKHTVPTFFNFLGACSNFEAEQSGSCNHKVGKG